MSMHKLTAGSGYDYLTRQVAALDATDKGHVGLADYYSAKGESPGRWVGAGMDGIDGLAAGDPVTAEQMQALFGAGLHPLAAERLAAILDAEFSTKVAEAAGRLGAPFKVYSNDVSPFRVAVAQRLEQLNRADGLPAGWSVRCGPGSALRWRRSSSASSTAVTRWMPGSWPGSLRRCRGLGRLRWPVST
jgi:TrwC relaxase